MRQVLKAILERASGGEEWRPSLKILQEAWPGLVGEKIAAVTRPAGVDWQGGELTVEAATENWRREIARHDDRLLERLRQVLPWELDHLDVQVADFGDRESIAAERGRPARPEESEADEAGGSDEAGEQRRVSEPDGDLDGTLDSLGEGTAEAARNILAHVRDHTNKE